MGKIPQEIAEGKKRHLVFINGCFAILKHLKCVQLKKELNKERDPVKVSHYVLSETGAECS